MIRIKQIIAHYFHRLNTGGRVRIQDPDEIPDVQVRESKYKPVVNLLLFIATFFTTTYAGVQKGNTVGELFLSGLSYSITVLSILLAHEFGHYCAARKFGVRATLPYFIPVIRDLSPFGTMGAVIVTKSPVPHRRALFYIGVMGPLPGFILSLAAFTCGIYLSPVMPLPTGLLGHTMVFGDSLLVAGIIKIIHGTIPKNHDIYLSPYALAGWFGFFITSLNLMPIGQLDGSHIIYSLVGRKQLFFGWAAVAGLAVLAFFWPAWIVWIIITFFMLMVAHPYTPEEKPLSSFEKAVGWLCMIIFIITFVPMPLDLI